MTVWYIGYTAFGASLLVEFVVTGSSFICINQWKLNLVSNINILDHLIKINGCIGNY